MSDAPISPISYRTKNDVAIIEINNPPVNALSFSVRSGIAEALKCAVEDNAIHAIILTASGKMFSAGADIREFGQAPKQPSLRDVITLLSDSEKPVIAAIHAGALGGGFELTLGCHYRLASDSARFGLPEVNIGILPGAGGTQRLPRIIGIEPALNLITTARQISAKEALDLGLVDQVATADALLNNAMNFARICVSNDALERVLTSGSTKHLRNGAEEIFTKFRAKNSRKFRGILAPEYAIQAVEAAIFTEFESGMVEERRLLNELLSTDQPAALRHVFFAERQAAKLPPSITSAEQRDIKCVGVIGAGTMGGGIAMNFLNAGIPVTIVDRTDGDLKRGLSAIENNYGISAKRGKINQSDIVDRMALLKPTTSISDLVECDLIIEAVFEQLDVKQDIFRQLDSVAKPDAILATNTSYLDIDNIASVTSRPENVIGLHFFSPANVMRLLEVVQAKHSHEDVIVTSMALGKKIGKVSVLVGNGYGFVGNRILQARQREAEQLILEGAAPWDIDKVFTDFGFAMGPFAMRDLVGLDVGWDPNDTASRTVREILNEMGRHGQKSGGGFYDYEDGRTPAPSPASIKVIEDFARREGIEKRDVSEQEIRDRALFAMVNEGAKILDEGISQRASDIDIIWVTGYGWPKHKGGPMYWADKIGLSRIHNTLLELESRHGEAFKPANLIVKLAAEGGSFNA